MGWPGPLTHRQLEAWDAWFTLDLDRPRPEHYYLALAAHEARYGQRKYKDFSFKDYRFRFAGPDDGPRGQDAEFVRKTVRGAFGKPHRSTPPPTPQDSDGVKGTTHG